MLSRVLGLAWSERRVIGTSGSRQTVSAVRRGLRYLLSQTLYGNVTNPVLTNGTGNRPASVRPPIGTA